ncbi:hypothetical protein MAR_006045 [Mya arenaria]|uniref:Ig-like domain-containing protein n=1 Tax=Mya arenaria TaxID=6604 RepID=A0ABY7DB11_MYAAR|nr:hypothetical protein MAR_006045 [Mya arenaria]
MKVQFLVCDNTVMSGLNFRIAIVMIVVCRIYTGVNESVIVSPSEVTVPEGSSLTLTCTYTGNDQLYGITWTNNGNDSGRKYDITIELSKPCTLFGKPGLNETLFTYTCFTLTVLNVTRNNQRDNFTCAAVAGAGTRRSDNSVIVYVSDHPGLPTLHLDSTLGPVIDGPLNIVVQQPFTLACNASSKPAANYTWTGGVNVAQDPPEDVSIRHESESGINIQSEFRVIKGDAVKLYCSVQSQPPSSYTWSGEGIHSLGSNLVYSNTLQSKTGTLSCFAGNSMMHGNQATKLRVFDQKILTEDESHISDNMGFNTAVSHEVRSAAPGASVYEATDAAKDGPDKSHKYMSLDESTSTLNQNFEKSKEEDHVYNNTMLYDSVQAVF